MKTYTMYEYGKLKIGDGESEIEEGDANRLIVSSKKSIFKKKSEDGVLRRVDGCLWSNGIVGFVTTSQCQLEILPKIEKRESDYGNANESRKWLIQMLFLVHNLKIDGGEIALFTKESHTIIDILIRYFGKALIKLVHQGLPLDYVKHNEDLTKQRGKIDINRQFTHLLFSPQKLACSFDELSTNTPLNRIMAATVRKLAGLARTTFTKNLVKKLVVLYSDVDSKSLTSHDFKSIVLTRSNHKWQELLRFAELILASDHQTSQKGEEKGFSLLFDMSELFEKYVGQLVTSEYRNEDVEVKLQAGKEYCLRPHGGGKKIFKTRPDIGIQGIPDSSLGIVDTKWKKIDGSGAKNKYGVKQSDVYQMMAYSRIYKCNWLVLLYPHNSSLDDDGIFRKFEISPFEKEASHLILATVDLRKNIRHQRNVLRRILNGCMKPG